ncbi:protein of unknown function [Methylacidimicrobium sp. AP8]|nr:protein of unknown function [Methylacidimicrobium sp. AP8]
MPKDPISSPPSPFFLRSGRSLSPFPHKVRCSMHSTTLPGPCMIRKCTMPSTRLPSRSTLRRASPDIRVIERGEAATLPLAWEEPKTMTRLLLECARGGFLSRCGRRLPCHRRCKTDPDRRRETDPFG